LKIAMVGDLASGRTVRSFCYLLGKFDDIEIVFVSPENLKMGEDIKEYLKRHEVGFREESDLNKVLGEVDVIYMTRIQKERISLQDYEKAKGKFVINEDNFGLVNEGSRVMHPLPHVEEIDLPIAIERDDTEKKVNLCLKAEDELCSSFDSVSPNPIVKSEGFVDKRVAYFRQAENGLYVRMALLNWVLNE